MIDEYSTDGKVDWPMIRALITRSMFGGKIDVDSDTVALTAMVDRVFANALNIDLFRPSGEIKAMTLPNGDVADIATWIKSLEGPNTT